MKANELRLGNFIKRANKRKYHKDYYAVRPSHLSGNTLCLFEPVPITEEWLLKFGFNHDEYHPIYETLLIYENDNFSLHANLNNGVDFYFYGYDHEASFEMKYIHELQNLYFALTKTELEIK